MNSASLQTFIFAGTTQVRVHIEDGVIEFCARDVCNALGHSNPTVALAQHCKGLTHSYPLQTPGGLQGATFIGEADLYRLVMRSTLPSAVQFQDWVVEEVLPALRQTGTYSVAPPAPQFDLPKNYLEALKALVTTTEEAEALKLTVAAQQPAVEFVDRYVNADGLFGIRETAKVLGITQHEFTSLCQRHHILFREGGSLQPYAEHLKSGYFQVKAGEANEHAFAQTRFTAKGVEWVRRKLPLQQSALQLTA